jgi:hypothetical protein
MPIIIVVMLMPLRAIASATAMMIVMGVGMKIVVQATECKWAVLTIAAALPCAMMMSMHDNPFTMHIVKYI